MKSAIFLTMKRMVIGCLCGVALAAVAWADGPGVPTSPSGRAAMSSLAAAATANEATVRQAAGLLAPSISCHVINAKAVGQDLGGGITAANIIGGGLLQGTTAASFTITGFSGSVASFAGPIVFTTHQGTLTVTVIGTFDVTTGEFSAEGSVTGATGKLAGATGQLSFHGIQDLTSPAFSEDVMGNVCVNLAP
jgi:hypothetical protein